MSDDGGVNAREGMEGLFRGQKGEKGDPGITPGAKHAVVYLFLLTVLLAAANLFWSAHEVARVRVEQQAQCKFDGDLGTAPVALNPATNKPSLLGVTIVSDARVAWHGLGCGGTLPDPAPSFTHWARYYHLPYR